MTKNKKNVCKTYSSKLFKIIIRLKNHGHFIKQVTLKNTEIGMSENKNRRNSWVNFMKKENASQIFVIFVKKLKKKKNYK